MNEEYIDIVDEQGRPTGIARPRAAVHRDGDLHATAHVWIVNSKNELLIQKRSRTKESHPGKWDISAAGHIAAGDSVESAAIRELGEELGVRVQPGDLLPLFGLLQRYADAATAFTDNEFTWIFLLRRDLDAAAVTCDPGEVEAVRFVALPDLKRRVATRDSGLVAHDEEYRRLFEFLERSQC